MIDVADALERILSVTVPLPAREFELTPTVLHHVLATDIRADCDSPAFTKSMMDGYAIRSADGQTAQTELEPIGEVAAGQVADTPLQPGQTLRVFTGAPLPPHADAVVKQEDTVADGKLVRLLRTPVVVGQHVLQRGTEMKAGEVILSPGSILNPARIGMLAALGITRVALVPSPTVAVLATGAELVDAGKTPTGAQIRNSNGPMLLAQATKAGARPLELGLATDDATELKLRIEAGLQQADVLLLSGGVSVGKYDLVPDVLRSLGVDIQFQSVRMKPGKPLLFGTWHGKLVFGLPGNPVSSFVGFELFVKPALATLRARPDLIVKPMAIPLDSNLSASHDRPTYHPAKLNRTSHTRTVTPLPWFGSADLRALMDANALLVLPPGAVAKQVGDELDVIPLHG